MEKSYSVEWGLPEQLDPPTDEEKQRIMKLINNKARKARVIDINVTKAMYEWLKENTKNAYIELIDIMETGYMSDHWIAVGINKEATKKWVARI